MSAPKQFDSGPGSASPWPAYPPPTVDWSTPPVAVRPNWGWMVVAIVFFWPLAIVSGISASRVDPALAAGNFELARAESARAKKYGVIALILGIVFMLLAIAVVVAVATLGFHEVDSVRHG